MMPIDPEVKRLAKQNKEVSLKDFLTDRYCHVCGGKYRTKYLCHKHYQSNRRLLLRERILSQTKEQSDYNKKVSKLPAHLMEIHYFARKVESNVHVIRKDYFMHIQEYDGLEVLHVDHIERFKKFIKELNIESSQRSSRIRIKTIRISDYLIALRGEEW